MIKNLAKTLLFSVIGVGTLVIQLANGYSAEGAVIITGEQVGNDVVFSYEGSINLTGLGTASSFAFGSSGITPSTATFSFLPNSPSTFDRYFTAISGPNSLGSGTGDKLTTSNSNNLFVFTRKTA